MKLRVGLVGLGEAWEKRHRPALKTLADRFEVRAICEAVSRRAELAAAQFDATVVDGFQTLLRREDVDAILVLSEQWFGWLPILAACESGKAVYLGTRLDMEPEQAQRIKQRVEQAGIAFMAEFPRRQAPATLRLKELIATNLGAPRLLFCHQRLPLAEENNRVPRQRAPASPGHELVELVDWCSYVVGSPPNWVTSIMHTAGEESLKEDYRMMSLDFSEAAPPGTGPIAQISCGRYFPAGWHEAIGYRPLAHLQAACQRGIAFVDLPATLVWFDEAGRHQESLESERPVGEQLLIQFYRAVTSLVSTRSNLDDAIRARRVVEQAQRSHREGRRIGLR